MFIPGINRTIVPSFTRSIELDGTTRWPITLTRELVPQMFVPLRVPVTVVHVVLASMLISLFV